jgi:site-specific DNA recombinase
MARTSSPAARARTGPVRAVLYARVSSEEQARKETIETQVFAARQYCEREGVRLVELYQDNGVSGTVPFEQRPGGKRLLTAARQGYFDVVLVYRTDRLGRLSVVSHIALHHLEALGVGLRSLTEPFDTSTPSGKFMFSILAANSALERETITGRAKDGLRRVAETGRWANGRPPYGYQIQDRHLVPDEPEAAVVKEIFARAVKRQPLIAIAAALNAQGIPTREGKRWRFSAIAHLLHRTTYKGEHHWGVGKHRITRAVPALVSEKTWQQAQEAVRLNAKGSRGNSKHDYLLKSLVHCGLCGRSMTGITVETSGESYQFYRCTGKCDPDAPARCPGRYIRADQLEPLVWNTLADWVLRRTDLDQALADSLRAVQHEQEETARTVTYVQQHLAAKTGEHDRVVSAFRRGLISEDDLATQLHAIDQEAQRLRETLTALKDRTPALDPVQLSWQIHQQLDRYRRDVQHGSLPHHRKRRIVEALVDRVLVRVPKGMVFAPTVREVIPYRDRAEIPPVAAGPKDILWQREPPAPGSVRSRKERNAGIEVRYRFPFAGSQAEPFSVISLSSLKRRSNIKTSSAIPA